MRYDFGRKFISKKTGLTGVEAKNIANKLAKQNIDYQVIDWETIGSDLYGHGHRPSVENCSGKLIVGNL